MITSLPAEASSARVALYQRSLDEYNQAYHQALVKAGAAVGEVVAESEDEDDEEDDDDEDEFPTQPASFDDEDEDEDEAPTRGAGRGLTVDGGAGAAGAGAPHSPDRGGHDGDRQVPLTPQGRLDDRIRLLRDRLNRELGRDVFLNVYGYLKEQRWGAEPDVGLEVGGEAFGDGGLDTEAEMQRELSRMLGGRDVTKYQRVVEHLLFMENSVGAL